MTPVSQLNGFCVTRKIRSEDGLREILNVYYSDGSFIYRQKDNALVKKMATFGEESYRGMSF